MRGLIGLLITWWLFTGLITFIGLTFCAPLVSISILIATWLLYKYRQYCRNNKIKLETD